MTEDQENQDARRAELVRLCTAYFRTERHQSKLAHMMGVTASSAHQWFSGKNGVNVPEPVLVAMRALLRLKDLDEAKADAERAIDAMKRALQKIG